jgi:hypothetical protein
MPSRGRSVQTGISQEESGSFLKKRTRKLLFWGSGVLVAKVGLIQPLDAKAPKSEFRHVISEIRHGRHSRFTRISHGWPRIRFTLGYCCV